MADERIENARRDLFRYQGKRGIASVDFLLLEALIHNAGVIPKWLMKPLSAKSRSP